MTTAQTELLVTPRRACAVAVIPALRTLVDVFASTVEAAPDNVAVEAPDRTLTYNEIAAAADELAGRLRALGVGPGDRVGVRIPGGTADLYVAILSVLHAGAAYVPVDADDPPERAQTAWQAADVCAVIGDGFRIDERFPGSGAGRRLRPENDAWVIFTSGSTGEPKGVAVTHRSAAAFVDAETELWTVTADDRVLAGLSVAFDASCEEMWLAWRNAAALVPAPRARVRSGVELGPWLRERGVTVISTVPTLAAMWEERALEGVRLLILGGEACPAALGWRLAAQREVWNTYGPTEATVVTTAAPVFPGRPISIGAPLAGWTVAVVGEDGEPVASGETGELVIAGVGLGRYLDAELDAKRFAPLQALGWERAYWTGDMARETPDGLEFVGRCDGQVKLGGRRVELGEIESYLLAVPGVRAAAATVRTTAAGNSVLVGYIVGEASPAAVLAGISERLPGGIVPLVVPLEELPTRTSGKVDHEALPWPPPSFRLPTRGGVGLTATERWLADRWADQLGPLPFNAESDFFELGGSSLAAAKLVSVIRGRFPSAAVADVYHHRRLGELATRLDQLNAGSAEAGVERVRPRRGFGALQLTSVLGLLTLSAPRWVIAILALNTWQGGPGPQVAWEWLVAGWLLFVSVPGKAAIVLATRRLLLPRLAPGRYPRHSWLACRLWFVERLADAFHLTSAAGTPMATTYARICGIRVGDGVHLGTLPPPSGLIQIGDHATLEANVDVHTWWIEGGELVVGEIRIGPGARIGARSLLMPGAEIGAGAEIEPGSVVTGTVPDHERWAGSPARRVGQAGAEWPTETPPEVSRRLFWRMMYGVGLAAQSALPLAAALPALALLTALGPGSHSLRGGPVASVIVWAPVIAASFLISYALLVALLVRAVSRLIRPGWQADEGATRWALWFSEALLDSSKLTLFPLYMSLYTRAWLRLAGVRIGERTELSHAVGLSRLVSIAGTSFAADDVTFATARARDGWLHVAPISVGSRTFLGNSAVVAGATTLGDDSLVGVLSSAPTVSRDGTSWFGSPPLELPRVPERADPGRTTHPTRPLVAGRAATELIRILLPTTLSVMLASSVYLALDAVSRAGGLGLMAVAAPLVIAAAGLCAVGLTVAAKWLIIGRYRQCERPFWSFFVWRDEIINSCQEQLAGIWLLNYVLATPLMSAYLRAMGAKVGPDVWCETLNVTEFDLVDFGEGCAINRRAHVETHLVHDRLMRLGPTRLEPGSTLGPSSAVLPDTTLGAGCIVGGRSVVMRGEQLPARTRWHGTPVVAA